MTKHGFAARAALLAAAALAVAGCDAINSEEAQKGTEAGADAAAGAAAGSAAPASTLDPLLANPEVGDVWAANLDFFSAAEFGEPGGADAFGLVQVVEVTPETATIITAQTAADDQASAVNQVGGYVTGTTWDPNERIPVRRAELETLVRDQRILRAVRPAGAGSAAPAAPAPAAPTAPGGGK